MSSNKNAVDVIVNITKIQMEDVKEMATEKAITAVQALKMTVESIDNSPTMQQMFALIRKAAGRGKGYVYADNFLDRDIPYLQNLGYTLYRKTNGKLLITWA